MVTALMLTLVASEPRPAQAQQAPLGTFTLDVLQEPRALHGAALLPDGKILFVAGGDGSEVFDPDTGSSVFVETPFDLVGGHTTTVLRDGRVLVAGGLNANNIATSTAMVFDPSTRRWTATGSMKEPRGLHAAALLPDGRVLITGGAKDPRELATDRSVTSSEIYDPAAGRFSDGPAVPPLFAHSAITLGSGNVLLLSVLSGYLYDPTANRIRVLPAMPRPTYRPTATLLDDGSVLITGGVGPGLEDVSIKDAQRFDPNTGRFSLLAGTMVQGRTEHTATPLPGGKVLIVGGAADGVGSIAPTNTTEILDLAAGTFSAGPTISAPRHYHTATRLSDGRIVIAGGGVTLQSAESIETYTPPTPPKPYAGQAPRPGSKGLMVTASSATATQLQLALGTDGCQAAVIAVLQAGAWRIYIPGAPAVVNASFPASLAPSTPVYVGCN